MFFTMTEQRLGATTDKPTRVNGACISIDQTATHDEGPLPALQDPRTTKGPLPTSSGPSSYGVDQSVTDR